MISELHRYYSGKKVLVTGHTGFVGSWLIATLNGLGAIVVGYSFVPTNPLYKSLSFRHKSYFKDIRNESDVRHCIKTEKPDIIFHLAAQAIVRESYDNPGITFSTNTIGTFNILNTMKDIHVPVLVNITTDKVYRNNENHPLQEDDPLGGSDIYSASKACSEILTNAYKESFLHSSIIHTARAGNIIGGGDFGKDRLFPDIMYAYYNNKELVIRNPEATRPFQFVMDIVHAYLLLGLTSAEYFTTWNFAPMKSYSVQQILNTVGVNYKVLPDTSKPEKKRLELNSTRAYNCLGWEPIYTIGTAVRESKNWYKEYYRHGNIEELTYSQIENFMEQI